MIKFAGKYAKELLERPAALMATGGLGAAGLATLGNVASGQAEYESPARMGLEALGAGALGALAARSAPAIVNLGSRSATRKAYNKAGDEMQKSGLIKNQRDVVDHDLLTKRMTQAAPYIAGALGAGVITGAGAVGGQFGGGIADLGNMAGLPIDPEVPGSSNTANSRLNMKSYYASQQTGSLLPYVMGVGM
jgi:hypothetical protein